MTDFAPGPWKAKQHPRTGWWGVVHAHDYGDANPVWPWLFAPELTQGTAFLIAASPTMYGHMHNALASLSKGTSEGVAEAIEELQAGLALADGQGDNDE